MTAKERISDLEQDIEIKTAKLIKLETSIMDYAKKNRLWKCLFCNRYKTFDDLLSGIKKSKWQQNANLDILAFTRLTFLYGPRTLNDIIRPDVEKYEAIKEEIEDMKSKLALLRNEELQNNPRAVTDDPDDNRNKWLKWNSGCFIINQSQEYEIPYGQAQRFIDTCFEMKFLNEKDKEPDDFDVDWLLANVKVYSERATIQKYIENHRVVPKKG